MVSQILVSNIKGEQIDNDALMRSLPALARETGIPMPVILRLKREYSEELPSIGVGSQQFFPQGVVPVLQALHSRENEGSGSGENGGRRGILSIARQRREEHEASERERVAPPKSKPRPRGQRKAPRDSAEILARRLERLEKVQQELIAELDAILAKLSRPGRAILPLP